jgi:shikimate dehydrogenase
LQTYIKKYRDDDNDNGLAITIPHKEKVIEYLDGVDINAQKIKAVNTVVKKKGRLVGYNTDWIGIYEPLKKLRPKTNVAILGGGGAARAALFACQKLGFTSTVFLRETTKGEKLHTDFGCRILDWTLVTQLVNQFQLIINTTPIGMYPNNNQTSIPECLFTRQQTVMDLIYNPQTTKLIQQAQMGDAHTISGSEMFIYQAQAQFNLLTGIQPDIDIVRDVFNSIAG